MIYRFATRERSKTIISCEVQGNFLRDLEFAPFGATYAFPDLLRLLDRKLYLLVSSWSYHNGGCRSKLSNFQTSRTKTQKEGRCCWWNKEASSRSVFYWSRWLCCWQELLLVLVLYLVISRLIYSDRIWVWTYHLRLLNTYQHGDRRFTLRFLLTDVTPLC